MVHKGTNYSLKVRGKNFCNGTENPFLDHEEEPYKTIAADGSEEEEKTIQENSENPEEPETEKQIQENFIKVETIEVKAAI